MSSPAKITLSAQELQLVTNTEWILTKRGIMEKAGILFGGLSAAMKVILEKEKEGLPLAVLVSEPKISKGENYRQLPYLMLDHPRCFEKENIFAIRTMFWWGNFFSITLHVSGSYKKTVQESLVKNIPALQQHYFIGINEDPWQHHFEKDNYTTAAGMEAGALKALLTEQHYIKIARKFSLKDWRKISGMLERSFSEMIQLVKGQLPSR